MKWLDNNSEDLFYINIGQFISKRGILLADINAIKYLVKTKKSDLDVNAVVTRTLGGGVVKVAGATEADAQLSVKFAATDFGVNGLNIDGRFYAGLAIKTPAMTDYLEVTLEDDDLIIVDSFFTDI